MDIKVNYCGKEAQERMSKNGWRLELPENYQETTEKMYERLSHKWNKVKIYWCGTAIRGIHSYFAFCKERKYYGQTGNY